ncbi:uncharacterized protein BT62DRAFT_1011262 [Guyanagaster necrorhizus]|uniref:Uncharacterized protein n=1 Tax=Guyanagaster necrorhizus TaxID=856835 RepID=A0A9P8ANA9_9AGAR|nr:uncharacterized protein BT62DRAFT_1011262 [Guyanagaster necrorhizus MCA 3950]KAG7441695.1 hypothetical protein BT62DRAFT_1011262 [Guyanagaster necrorhizus MCA 3950]
MDLAGLLTLPTDTFGEQSCDVDFPDLFPTPPPPSNGNNALSGRRTKAVPTEVFAIGLSNGFHCKDLVMALVADDPTLLLCYVERWLKIFAGEIILDHASDPRRFTENRPWMFHCGLPIGSRIHVICCRPKLNLDNFDLQSLYRPSSPRTFIAVLSPPCSPANHRPPLFERNLQSYKSRYDGQ